MKITVLSENLHKALTLVTHAISSKNQLPILSSVFIEASNGKISMSATDLEIGIETTIPGSIEADGNVVVLGKVFLELVSSLPAGKITVTTEEGNLHVESAKTKSTLQTANPEEFPKLYDEKGEKAFAMPVKALQATLKRIIFTASSEATRPALSGIFFKKIEDGYFFVATDGYRLSLEKVIPEESGEVQESFLVPVRLVREVLSLKEDGKVTLYKDSAKNQILFSQETAVLVGRLLEAEFPNYEKILPTDASTTITLDREALLRAVKTCAIFARETANVITFTIQKDHVLVSAKTPSLGENTVEVDCRLVGEENAIAFNGRYLLEFLSVADSQDIQFEMTGPLNSGVFRLIGNDSYLHLIMPIRTQE